MPGCALRYCRNTSKNTDKSSGVTFHRFPRALNGPRDKWVQFVRTDRSEPEWAPTEHAYLCSDHFTEHDFIYTSTGRKFTKLSAVPTIPSQYSSHDTSVVQDVDGNNVSVDDKANDGSWDSRYVVLEGSNVRPAVGGRRMAPDYGVILEAATTIREPGVECSVFGCRNGVRQNPEKEFFSFPTTRERYNVWLKLINREDLATRLGRCSEHRVCSDHFDSSDFDGHTLKETAVPQFNLPLRKVSFVYDNSEAGQSGWHHTPIKKEVVEPMDIEIQIQPEAHKINEPHVRHEPCIPIRSVDQFGFMDVSDSNTLETGTVSHVRTLTKWEIFLQNATISPVEVVSLPGILEEPKIRPIQSAMHTQTTKLLADQMNAPLRKKYEVELREIKKYIRAWETKMARYARSQMGKQEFQQNCDIYLDEKFSNIVKFHVNMANKPSGNRYSSDFKTLVLNLFFASPRAYNFVEKLFQLPSRATTVRTQLPIRTGINTLFVEYFKAKVDKMNAKEKTCLVYFGNMELSKNLRYCVNNDFLYGLHDIDQVIGTEPAEFATLIMVKGLYAEWKQPISFAYVSEKRCYTELKEWLYKIIALLFDIGLNVKALVMNSGSEFLEFPEVSVAEPYFEVFGHKVYQIYDVPVLFKGARDALMENDFHIGSKVVKWSYITKVYSADKKQELRLIPKLTDAHVRPEGAENDLTLAIQVFSRTVAAAMNAHVIAKRINCKAKDTVEFIQTMNNLFDMLSSQKIKDENEFKRAYAGTEGQKKFLTETFEYLKQLEVKNKKGNSVDDIANFVTGLLITMKSMNSLLEDLQQENFKYIMTKNFSMDCMKVYFDKVRKLGGNCCTKPTPIMFARSFRRLFLVHLVSNTKGVSEMDLKTTLTKMSDFVKVNDDTKKDDSEPAPNRFLKIAGGDCLKLWPKPGPTFTGGYLLYKCLEKHHMCQALIENLCNQYKFEVSNAETLIAKFKEYNPKNLNKTDLLEPPEFMVNAVLKMDEIFEEYNQRVDKDLNNFGWNIYLKMEDEVFSELPCVCFPLMYMKQLFIRMRVFHMTRHYNTNVKQVKRKLRRENKGK